MNRLYEMLPRQKKIWEIQRLYPNTDICNIGGYLHLEGKYDTKLLQRCIEIFLQCNSSFWIKVNSQNKIYFDKITKYAMEEYDFTDLTLQEVDSVMQSWICEPMPPYDSYLFNFRLLRVEDKVLIFEKFHHLIADGYAVALCARSQEKIYQELLDGRTNFEDDQHFLEEYAKFKPEATDKNHVKKDDQNNRMASFAKRAVRPKAEILTGWITDGESRADDIEWCQKRFQYKKICEFCRKYRVSVEAFIYGCMTMYLCRAMDAEGLAIGRNLLNRSKDTLHMIGLRVETRTFVTEPKWELSAADYLADLKKKLAVHASETEDFSYRPEIEISYRPQRYLPAPKQGECREFFNSSLETPMKVFVNESRRGIEVVVKYQEEALSERKVRRIMEKTFFFMEQVLSEPEIPCSQIQLLRERERRQIESMQRGAEWKYTLSLPERFLDMVRKHSQKTAVLWQGETYSYQQFYDLVKTVMGVIAAKADPGKEHVIGLCLSRTPYLPAAIYASWLLGYAFLPISPEETEQRREQMCRGCALCLTDELLSEKQAGMVAEDVKALCCKELPAYQIYTSGTSGEPKAVKISHYSLSCRLEWMEHVFSDGIERILQKTRSSFDVSIWELVLPFAFGKSLCMLKDGEERSPKAMIKALISNGVTMVHFVPSMFERFLFFLQKQRTEFSKLRYIILSGEELGAELVHWAKKLLPRVQLYNLYGPTECTIDVSYYCCEQGRNRIPIGKPVYATNLSVRNQRGQLLPMGVQGELIVEGALVGIGSDKDQGGYGILDGKRIYCTGDLAVLMEDGFLYYEGRKDQQLKIRGMRINLMEVERCLNHAVPGVKCLVFTVGNRLVAFCQGKGTPEYMRQEAAKHLAYYSIPSEFIFIDQLPVQKNGKAGRKELEYIYQNRYCQKPVRNAFSKNWELSRREKVLLSLAKRHLKSRVLDLDHNLWDAGMDSLTMLSFLADCEAYNICIPSAVLYHKPNLRDLAKESFNGASEGGVIQHSLVFLQRHGSKKLLLAVPFAGGTPLSIYPLTRWFAKNELDVASVNLSYEKNTWEESIEMTARAVASSEQLKDYEEIYLLGDCAGSVLAMQIAAKIGSQLQGLLLCEALPNLRSFWDYVPDQMLEKVLGRIRGKPVYADQKLLHSFRKDVKRSAAALRTMGELDIKGKITLVFGGKDMVTFGYQKRYRRWHRWIHQPFRVYHIPQAGHFLIEDYPLKIAKIIRKEFLD